MPRGLTRRIPALILAAALAATLASGCAKEAAAASVGDEVISKEDLMQEVKALYDNDALWESSEQGRDALKGEAAGSYAQSFVAGVLQQRITFVLLGQLFDDQDGEITDQARSQARTSLSQEQFGPAFDEFSEDYQDELIDDYAKVIVLQEDLGEEKFNEALREVIDSTEVDVNSRYGHWDAELFKADPGEIAIIPPVGAVTTETTTAADG